MSNRLGCGELKVSFLYVSGYLKLLSQLTVVGDVTEEQYKGNEIQLWMAF